MKFGWRVIKGAFDEFFIDKVPRLSAALAYYALFSLAPLVIIAISVAGMFFGEKVVTGQVHDQLREFFGNQGAQAIESMMQAAEKTSTNLVASIVGAITLLVGATGVFGQLQDALNTIWEVKPKPGRGIKGFIRDRFLSLTMVLGTGFLLLVSMVLSAVMAALAGTINSRFGFSPVIAEIVHVTVSFIVITLLFAMIFKFLPDARIPWRNVWFGAIFTAALFTLGKFLLGFYLGRAATASSYGAAGSLVVVLLWVYYSSLILFFGAEVTQVYATVKGWRIEPSPNAVPLTEQDRAEQGIPKEAQSPARKANGPSVPEPAMPGAAFAGAAHFSAEPAHPQPVSFQSPAPNRAGMIHQKPWRFLSAAVVLGFVSSFLFKRNARAHS